MKHLMKFNELNSSTYNKVAKLLSAKGGMHKVRAKKIEDHAKNFNSLHTYRKISESNKDKIKIKIDDRLYYIYVDCDCDYLNDMCYEIDELSDYEFYISFNIGYIPCDVETYDYINDKYKKIQLKYCIFDHQLVMGYDIINSINADLKKVILSQGFAEINFFEPDRSQLNLIKTAVVKFLNDTLIYKWTADVKSDNDRMDDVIIETGMGKNAGLYRNRLAHDLNKLKTNDIIIQQI